MLRKKIDNTMQNIQKQEGIQKDRESQKNVSASYIHKGIGAVSGIFRGWLY